MFAVIYRFKLKPEQEKDYQRWWRTVADYFIAQCGAIGSRLHKGEDGLWLAYSCWPDKKSRDAAWPGDKAPNNELPADVQDAIMNIQALKRENKDLEQYDEICLDVVEDCL